MSTESQLLTDVIELAPENSRWMFSEGSSNLPSALIELTEKKYEQYHSILLTPQKKGAIKDLIVAHSLVDKIVHQFIEDTQNGVVFEGYDHLTGCFLNKDFPNADSLLETYSDILEEMT